MTQFTPEAPADITLAPKAFSSWEWGTRVELDRAFPSYLSSVVGNTGNGSGGTLPLEVDDTHYGYVDGDEGDSAMIVYECPDGNPRAIVIHAGMAFSVAGPAQVMTRKARVAVISREQYRGLPMFVGPIEQEGRLKYIDGCTDSLLIPPVKLGDPCLNLLYFPPGIDQTTHTHPSDRIGLILSGHGRCHAWDLDETTGEYVEKLIDLTPGMLFTIHTNGKHKFSTPYGESMRVLAYHPDSDFGPEDENHPMLNRTIVDGVSAKHIDAIRTE